jgi:arachidonate 15-lipoxygenase
MTAFLPQNDPHAKRRQKELTSRQSEYEYCYDYVSPLALVEHVPFRDEFSIKWMTELGQRLLVVLENLASVEHIPEIRAHHQKQHKLFQGMVKAVTFDVPGLLEVLQSAIEMRGGFTRPSSYNDYAKLFHNIGLPPVHRDYRQDQVFADLRLAGPNPTMIKKVSELDDRFPVTDEHFRTALPDDSLEAAGKEGRLFLTDYHQLEALENSTYPIQKYIYAPLALFAVDKVTRQFVPVAIQCKQVPASDNPIFTRNDGYNWLIAKTIVGMADGNFHEPVTHLAKTHLFMEPFCIATMRHLATKHPVGLLLRPHFEGMLHINGLAHEFLIAPTGGVARLCGGSIESISKLIVSGVQDYSFNEAMLAHDFKARGVEDAETLPNYPFRDDAMLYWDIIGTWVSDYLSIYYHSDADVQEDTELANWYQEIVSGDGGRISGFGRNNTISSFEYLVDAVRMIIYTCSVQHAAVNFPQYDLMSYVGSMPLAVYKEAPTSTAGGTEEDFLDTLPPLEQAHLQACLGYSLGTLHYTSLGHYGWGHFRDHRASAPLKKFRQAIADTGEIIARRNEKRRPYKFLLPDGIPQSINI